MADYTRADMSARARLDELARATPTTRDRSIDFLRAASIVAVVFGHWFIGIIHWRDGLIWTTSAVGVTSWLWLGTWFLQVMPVFFFVGGFSNLVSLESARAHGQDTASWLRGRLKRLLRPSLVFLGAWAVVQVGLHLLDVGAPAGPTLWGGTRLLRGMKPPGATVPFGPLWFLAVYVVVVAIAPVTVALDRRFGGWVPVTMAAGAVVVDVIGFGLGHPRVRWFNVAFLLLFAHQLGHFCGDGRLDRARKALFWAMAIGGLLGLVLLTTSTVFRLFGDVRFEWFPKIGHYPKSLLGTDVERISNAYPPTVCFLLGGVWSIGAVMLLRPRLRRWLDRERPWRLTIGVNAIIMTLFLWHMTAYLLAILALWPLGLGHQTDSTARWWAERVVWEAVPAAILAVIVLAVGRFERIPPRPA
jgi:fucose 4-O-acetylase-like acetyltransferase